jgi:Regulator of Chromosome Condensation (RCC1) repeat protein
MVRPVQRSCVMRRSLILCLVLPACVDPSPTPRQLAWSVHAITASGVHTLVLTDRDALIEAGTVKSDGAPVALPADPSTGAQELVLPIATAVAVGARHACVISTAQVMCWGDNEDGQLARSDAFLVGDRGIAFTGATDLVAGTTHTCALRPDHTAWCWGRS